MKTSLDSMQRSYDNMSPPEHDAEDVAREEWEGDLDLRDVFTVSEMQEIFWDRFYDEPWFKKRLDEAWAKHCKACEADDFCEAWAKHCKACEADDFCEREAA